MATLDFEVSSYGRDKGRGAATLQATTVVASGQDTITTVENIEDAAGDITVSKGQVFSAMADAKMRISFGGVAATATTGLILPANVLRQWEGTEGGTVSAVEAT